MLGELRAAEDSIKGTLTEPQGTLVVTAPVAFGRIHVVPIVTALLQRNPRLAVRLALIDRSIDLVEEGIDVAVRIGELADSALRAIQVGAVRSVLVASPAYLQARGVPVSPQDLRRHELIVFTAASPSDEWRFGAGGKRSVRIRPRMSVNTADAAISAAEAGSASLVCSLTR
jgi:DNA-binding transcriptional LysR family regulator